MKRLKSIPYRMLKADEIVKIWELKDTNRTSASIADELGIKVHSVYGARATIKEFLEDGRERYTAAPEYFRALQIIEGKTDKAEEKDILEAVEEVVLAEAPIATVDTVTAVEGATEDGDAEQRQINKITDLFETLTDEIISFAKKKVQKDFMQEKVDAQIKILNLEEKIQELTEKNAEMEAKGKGNSFLDKLRGM